MSNIFLYLKIAMYALLITSCSIVTAKKHVAEKTPLNLRKNVDGVWYGELDNDRKCMLHIEHAKNRGQYTMVTWDGKTNVVYQGSICFRRCKDFLLVSASSGDLKKYHLFACRKTDEQLVFASLVDDKASKILGNTSKEHVKLYEANLDQIEDEQIEKMISFDKPLIIFKKVK